MSAIRSITNLLGLPGNNLRPALQKLEEEDQNRVATVLLRPDLNVRYNPTSETLAIHTSYGTINVDATDFHHIRNVYVNGQEYSVLPQTMLDGIDALEHLTGSYGEVMLALDEPVGTPVHGTPGAPQPEPDAGRYPAGTGTADCV